MTVKEKRRLELAIRAERLHRDGYADYTEYIHSRHWKLTRSAYFAHPDTPKACFCGEDDEWKLYLHHKTYVRIGAEDLRDLHPMCDTCHNDVHLIAKRGLAPFDLEDYASEDRRRNYAYERGAALQRRGEMPDRHPEAPFDGFNWRIQAQARHSAAKDRRQAAREASRRLRRMA